MVQSLHCAPAAPQVVVPVPAWHSPPEQHAPLHGWVALQLVLHECVLVLHEAPDAQSVPVLQPQIPPPVAATHAEPTPLPAQP
jgi:hypothetical protein